MSDKSKVPYADRKGELTRGYGRTYGDVAPGLSRHLFKQAFDRLHRAEQAPVEVQYVSFDEAGSIDQHMIDAMKYGVGVQWVQGPPSIKTFSNTQLIHEMLERGFAVMKLPVDGGPPEVLKDG